MGNKIEFEKDLSEDHLKGQRVTQLSISGCKEETVWEQTIADENVCCFKYSKTIKKKIVWETKFINTCEQIVQDFTWASELINVVSDNELPKVKYYREVHSLKRDKPIVETKNQESLISNPDQLQRFKKNLKKSVIISFAHGTKGVELPTIKSSIAPNTNRSRLQRRKQNSHSFVFYKEKTHSSSNSVVNKSHSSLSNNSIRQTLIKEKDISKETAFELQIFLKFSNILERHMADMSCVLGQIKKSFIDFFQQHYRDSSAASKQLDYVIESVQQFLQLLRDAVMDYYNLATFAPPGDGCNIFISNDDNILSTVTAIVFRDHTFYNCLFNLIAYEFRQRQRDFNKILNHLKNSGPERFTVKEKFCLNWLTIKSYVNHLKETDQQDIVQNIEITDIIVDHPEPYRVCMNYLNQMAKARAPVNKLKSIMACSEGITQQIQKFYQNNGLRKEKWMLDADQVLSVFCYLIVGARVDHLHTHLFILDNFASSHQMISMTGYYLSVIRCAVEQLQNEFIDVVSETQTARLI